MILWIIGLAVVVSWLFPYLFKGTVLLTTPIAASILTCLVLIVLFNRRPPTP